MKRDLIVFGEDWTGLPSSTKHLIKGLASSRKIVWINSIGLRKPKLDIHDLSRAVKKLTKSFSRKVEANKSQGSSEREADLANLFPYTLFSFPAPSSKLERFIVKKILCRQIKPLINKHKLNDPIFWFSLPTASDLKDEFPSSPFVYYCCDDFQGLAGVDHETAKLHEDQILAHAELVVTSSKALQTKFHKTSNQLLTHGVDLELFSNPTTRAEDLPSNKRPIAGFYGSIASWIDVSLLQKVIEEMSHWDFVFIGKVDTDISKICALSNVYFLGPKPHSELPKYVQHWDVSILPFKNNEQINACNPLKLKEYMAAGTPIISSPFPELEKYQNHVSVASSSAEMCRHLNASLSVDKEQVKKALRRLVINEAWQQKSIQLDSWLAQL